jgi:hypothetical protein
VSNPSAYERYKNKLAAIQKKHLDTLAKPKGKKPKKRKPRPAKGMNTCHAANVAHLKAISGQ